MSLYNSLIQLGGQVVKPIRCTPRQIEGNHRRYEGSTWVLYNGFYYYLELWFLGPLDGITEEMASYYLEFKGLVKYRGSINPEAGSKETPRSTESIGSFRLTTRSPCRKPKICPGCSISASSRYARSCQSPTDR